MAKKKKTTEVVKTDIFPEVSIGLVGHVDHGKTTLTERLSGKWTDTHSEEIKRGITIRLGYADSIIYKCEKCNIFNVTEKCPKCNETGIIQRKVSFIDAPGHESLMATMLSGANIMDGALLLVAANEECPQPQTLEHLKALEIIGVHNVIIIQNKIDVVDEKEALTNYHQIKDAIKNTPYKNAPIIPISAKHRVNMDLLIQAIQDVIKTPARDTHKDPIMLVARSFDVNKPGTDIAEIKGGVLGGALRQGILKVGDLIEILPGRTTKEANKEIWKPIHTKITNIIFGSKSIGEVTPGGSFGIETTLDPSILKSDKLTGAIVGHVGKMPQVWYEFKLTTTLLDRVVGAKDQLVVDPLKIKEVLMLNVNSAATVGVITNIAKNTITCTLKIPVCADVGARVTISRQLGNRWRLIGFGEINK